MCRPYSSPFSGLQVPSATYRQNDALKRVFALVFTPCQFSLSTWWRLFFWSISGENHYLQVIGREAVQCLKQPDVPLSKLLFLLENVTAELPQVLMCLNFSMVSSDLQTPLSKVPLSPGCCLLRLWSRSLSVAQRDTEGCCRGKLQLTERAGESL